MLALANVAQLDTDPSQVVEITNLHAMAQDLAVECSPLIADKELDFALETSGAETSGYLVGGHEWLIRELFRNLMSNAMRHTPRGSAFGIDIRAKGNTLRMSVWDSGSGIDAEREAKLFEPFSSGDPRTGSGLGLIICRDICKLLGAKMTLKNRALDEPGAPGLRVTVRFG